MGRQIYKCKCLPLAFSSTKVQDIIFRLLRADVPFGGEKQNFSEHPINNLGHSALSLEIIL